MSFTYTIIASNILTTNSALVTFSNIPQTFTDLVLRLSVRSDRTANFDSLEVRFNGDTATNYSSIEMFSNSISASPTRYTSETLTYINFINGNTSTASTFSSNEFYIPNYRVSANKPWSSYSIMENNAATANTAFIDASALLYRSTAAITSMTLRQSAGSNMLAGSSFTLYGISNS